MPSLPAYTRNTVDTQPSLVREIRPALERGYVYDDGSGQSVYSPIERRGTFEHRNW